MKIYNLGLCNDVNVNNILGKKEKYGDFIFLIEKNEIYYEVFSSGLPNVCYNFNYIKKIKDDDRIEIDSMITKVKTIITKDEVKIFPGKNGIAIVKEGITKDTDNFDDYVSIVLNLDSYLQEVNEEAYNEVSNLIDSKKEGFLEKQLTIYTKNK